MQAYFEGAIPQLISRAEALDHAIRSNLPPDYLALAALCRQALAVIRGDLIELRDNPDYRASGVQGERLRTFRRCRKTMTQLESRAIATLDRVKDEDLKLNALVRRIIAETRHVPLPPVVSPLSQMYFSMDTHLNILFVPLVENRFLLHLPDVYHEIAHQALADKQAVQLAPIRSGIQIALRDWLTHCDAEKRRLSKSRGPRVRREHVDLAQRCIGGWLVEFFCDLYAVHTVGPAYGWSHLHLASLFGGTPFAVPRVGGGVTTHPADDARMYVILEGLRHLDADIDADAIQTHWTAFKDHAGYTPSPEYALYYPPHVLAALPEAALDAYKRINLCQFSDARSDSVSRVLNQAWQKFWHAPKDYVQWEERAVDALFR